MENSFEGSDNFFNSRTKCDDFCLFASKGTQKILATKIDKRKINFILRDAGSTSLTERVIRTDDFQCNIF